MWEIKLIPLFQIDPFQTAVARAVAALFPHLHLSHHLLHGCQDQHIRRAREEDGSNAEDDTDEGLVLTAGPFKGPFAEGPCGEIHQVFLGGLLMVRKWDVILRST